MQTFLPYKSFKKSAECLDNKRLGKQRVEAMQIIDILCNNKKKKKGVRDYRAWSNHPAILQWEGYEVALFDYLATIQIEWKRRGFNGNGIAQHMERLLNYSKLHTGLIIPPWLGKKKFHDSHKSRLLQKDKKFYSQYGWKVPEDLEYYWPVRKNGPSE